MTFRPDRHAGSVVTEITSREPIFPDLREAWRHRQLAVMLAQRNIKVRYKQTILGSAWIVIQPLLLTGMLTLILGALLSVPSGGLPYALFAFTGTGLWTAFNRVVTDTGISLASSSNVILKVYFPRVLVPAAALLTAVVDFLPIYAMLILATVAYGRFPGWPILLSPAFVFLALVMAFAVGLWVTMLDAIYRDMRLVVPSVLQLLFYASPVMYAETVVPARWQTLYHLNPLVGLLEGFRWSFVAGAAPPSVVSIVWCVGLSIVMLFAGLSVFARLERFAVDRI
ncbi:MAG: ABC transporter permease [Stellaceae bacterium]